MPSFNFILCALALLGFAAIGHSVPNSYHTSREVHFARSNADPKILEKRFRRMSSTLPPGYPRMHDISPLSSEIYNCKTYFGTIDEIEFIKANEAAAKAAEEAASKDKGKGGGAAGGGSAKEPEASTTNLFPIKLDPMEWEDLDRYAADAYEFIGHEIQNYFNGIVVVTAQYTPKVGLSVWSKPREDADVEYLLGEKFGKKYYPHYIEFISTRKMVDEHGEFVTPPPGGFKKAKFIHAEDAAAIGSAVQVVKKQQKGEGRMRRFKFPANTRAVTYGKFSKTDTVGVKPPCGAPNTVAKFTSPCFITSPAHGISYTSYKGPLGGWRADLGGTGEHADGTQENQAGGSGSPKSDSLSSGTRDALNELADKMDTNPK